MRQHCGGGGILDLGIGDDADRHTQPPLHQTGDGLDPWIVERVEGAVGVDSHGIDRGLMAGRIGAGGIRGVGDDRIAARGGDQRHLRHVVDGELAERLALRDALRQHSRRHAMRQRHAVADEQDDVLRLARCGIVDLPAEFAGLNAVGHADLVSARLGEQHIAQEQGRLVLAGLALDERGGLAENLGIVFAVQGDGDFCRIGEARKFDFEIEPCTGQNIRSIDGIDRLRRTGRRRHRNRNNGHRRKHRAHVQDPQRFGVIRPIRPL